MASTAFQHGYALLVGVGADLPCTVSDAVALADLLRDPARAAYPADHVQLLTEGEASRPKLLAAFEELRNKVNADPEATAVVFFSGHGARLETAPGQVTHYLLANGYDVTSPQTTCVSDRELTSALSALSARKLLVLLDCCHAAGMPLPKDPAVKAHPALPPSALAVLGEGQGNVVLASCRAEERSFTSSPNSLFTTCLLEALGGKAPSHLGFARVLEVVSYVMREVPLRHPQQHPFLNRAENLSESFAICRVASAQAPATGPLGGAKSAPLPAWKETSLRRKIAGYSRTYELRLKRLEAIRVAQIVTADAGLQFQYKHEIETLESEVAEDEKVLARFYSELGEG